MSEIAILRQFKKGLVSFFDELIAQFPLEGDLVLVRIFIKDQAPIVDVMNHFIQHLLPLKTIVLERNSDFFLKNNVLFEALDKGKVNHFKRMWNSGSFDDQDKETIFRWFESFISLSEKYHKVRSV